MNIVNRLTIRHLKLNKRRTLVTIIGVIISVAMITAVATISASFLNLMQRQAIASEGEWHVQYNDVTKDQLAAIKQDEATKTLVISRDVGYAQLEGSNNGMKPYLYVQEYNKAGFQHFPIVLSEGRLPQNEHEVVISEEIALTANVDYRIGDTLSLEIGQRYQQGQHELAPPMGQDVSLHLNDDMSGEELRKLTKQSYTIVGTIKRPRWEYSWSPGYTILSYVDESLLEADDRADGSVVLNRVGRSLYSHAEQLAETNGIGIEHIDYNRSLLRYYGVTNNSGLNNLMYSLSAIIMSVIIVGSISLIYNAFAISVSERSRHLGMLSSVGATRRQKRNSVFFEGAIIGIISIPLGIVSGLVGIGITFLFINSVIKSALGLTESLNVTVTPFSIVIAAGVSALTIFISSYVPARRASKVSAIEAIRQTPDIKLTGKAVKTSKLVRKLFGFEAEIGLKNLKRNKRRYQATVFSLVISIVLFLSVSYFTDNLKKTMELSRTGINFDIEIGTWSEDLAAPFFQSVTHFEEITEYSVMKELELHARVDQAYIAEPLKIMAEQNEVALKNGKFRYIISVHALDKPSLAAYATKIGADYEDLIDPSQMKAIVVDRTTYRDTRMGKYVEANVLYTKIGESISLLQLNRENDSETEQGAVEIAALTNELPMGVLSAGLSRINMIVSDTVLDRLLEKDTGENLYVQNQLLITSTDPMKTERDIAELDVNNDFYIQNVYEERQKEEQLIMLLSVFTYGFILLITAISVANIFNTISTSISLRKREFAMLKSVGMTPKGFNKMINYESIFYGIKSLLYGLPVSVGIMLLIHRSIMNSFSYPFELPWLSILYVIFAVFVLVGSAMLYSSSKVKKENIIDAIKQESI